MFPFRHSDPKAKNLIFDKSEILCRSLLRMTGKMGKVVLQPEPVINDSTKRDKNFI